MDNSVVVVFVSSNQTRREPFVTVYATIELAMRNIAMTRQFSGKAGNVALRPIAAPIMFDVVDGADYLGTLYTATVFKY